MSMHWADWLIVAVLMTAMTATALVARRYMQSVADFMAAGRHVGRYLLCTSYEMASIGAVSIVAVFEQFYAAGFVGAYWYILWWFVSLVIALSGWVVYRFRATRAMTMAQFFEIRYSRRFRVFAGVLAFLAGIVNFGIFPAVGARFFIYFCGLPSDVHVLGLSISSFALIMILLLSIALLFTFIGGQVVVTLTDFLQGTFFSFVLLLLVVTLLRTFGWQHISEALASAPADASLVNPFRTSEIKDFNKWFFLIGAFALVYHHMAWQGNQGYFCAARNPHEARMGRILFTWKQFIEKILIIVLPVGVYTLLHHADFAPRAEGVRTVLDGIAIAENNEQIATQMTVPVGLSHILPVGLMGCLCAAMLAAFITTHDTYLHSWGSIFVQDVVLPLRGRPLSPRHHILLLRLSICGVAVFVFCFSLLFRQTEHVYMFFAITGAIYLGGAGSVIVGGLYWRRGTTEAAWASMIVGSTLAVSSIVIKQIHPEWIANDTLRAVVRGVADINGQLLFGISMACSITTYVGVSLLGPRRTVDLDRILHRGAYAVETDRARTTGPTTPRPVWQRWLGMGDEFTRGDRFIYLITILWTAGWIILFAVGTIWNLVTPVGQHVWLEVWRLCMGLALVVGGVMFVWFLIGGLFDLRDMLRRLRTAVRDDSDDGSVPRPSDQAHARVPSAQPHAGEDGPPRP